ncbi:MAG: serine protease [Melioribacteraceae bacterium]
MITVNILTRVFNIRYNDASGTAFTLDINNRQYLITAKHIIENITYNDTIEIFHDEKWNSVNTKLVGHCEGIIDISALTLEYAISPRKFIVEAKNDGLIVGQDVYFLGFPYGLSGTHPSPFKNFPTAFIKKATLSAAYFNYNGIDILFLDGINNPGFSGGPVIFSLPQKYDYKVAAVISGYRTSEEPIYKENYNSEYYYKSNTGIIISYGIDHIKKVINKNQIGVILEA